MDALANELCPTDCGLESIGQFRAEQQLSDFAGIEIQQVRLLFDLGDVVRLGFVEHFQIVLSLPHRPGELLFDLFEFLQKLFDVFGRLAVAFDLFEFVPAFDLHGLSQFIDPLLEGFEILLVLTEFLRPAIVEFLADPHGFELIRIEVELCTIRKPRQPVLAARAARA